MNRLQTRQRQGRRELIAVILLVVPLIAIGYYLAAIGVAVDPPPDPVADSTPAMTSTPTPDPERVPASPTTLPGDGAPATPRPGASRVLPMDTEDAVGMRHGTASTIS